MINPLRLGYRPTYAERSAENPFPTLDKYTFFDHHNDNEVITLVRHKKVLYGICEPTEKEYTYIEDQSMLDKFTTQRFQTTWERKAVYVIHSTHGSKVGISVSPKSRYANIRVNLPVETRMIRNYFPEDALREEGEVHRAFSDKHIRGEWYNLSSADIQRIDIYFLSLFYPQDDRSDILHGLRIMTDKQIHELHGDTFSTSGLFDGDKPIRVARKIGAIARNNYFQALEV